MRFCVQILVTIQEQKPPAGKDMNKRKRIFVVLLCLVCAIFLFACDKDEGIKKEYTVRFVSNGGTPVQKFVGRVIDEVPLPTYDGFIFEGWYENEELSGSPIVFPFEITGDMYLYAKWYSVDEGNKELTYVLDSAVDGYTVTGYKGSSHRITVPSLYNGKPVYFIADGAFNNCNTVREIYLSDGIRTVGKAFYRCANLESILISEKNQKYTAEGGVLYSKDKDILVSYPPAKKADRLEIPESVVSVANSAIRFCVYLKEIYISKNVTEIDKYFEGCYALEKIEAASGNPVFETHGGVLYSKGGKSLLRYPQNHADKEYSVREGTDSVAQYAFDDGSIEVINIADSVTSFYTVEASTLKAINASANNTIFSSVDGVLFDKKGERLIQYPRARAAETAGDARVYTVPATVQEICSWAFSSVIDLTKIVIPPSVRVIDEYAFTNFYKCFLLEEIEFLPLSRLASVGSYAFMEISSIKEIVLTAVIPPSVGAGIFSADAEVTVTVPVGAFELYNSSAWNMHQATLKKGEEAEKFVVSFDTVGGESLAAVSASYIKDSPIAVKAGYVHGGWFFDAEYRTPAAFPMAVYENVKLYARWYKAQSGTEGVVLGLKSDGSYTVTSYVGSASVVYVPTSYSGALVTEIADRAFSGCLGVEEVYLPESIKTVGENAFAATSSSNYMRLRYINLEETEISEIKRYAFRYCVFLDNVVLPSTLEKIGNGAFSDCVSLSAIALPNVLEIGDFVFSGCSSLSAISAGADSAFSSVDGVLFSKDGSELYRFPENKNTAEYIIPDGVRYIRPEAFFGVSRLKKLTFTSDAEIGVRAFYYCTALEELYASAGVTELGFSAFKYSSLHYIYIGASVAELALDFSDLDLMLEIEVAESNAAYASFEGALYNKKYDELYYFPSGRSSAVLHEGLKKIGAAAFSFSNIERLSLGDIEEIGYRAFYGCDRLISFVASSVKSIGEEAFVGAARLSVVQLSCGAPSFGRNALSSEKVRVYVPEQYVSGYINALGENFQIRSSTTVVDGLEVELINGEYYIIRKETTGKSDVEIPAYIGETPVKEIAREAFSFGNIRVFIPKEVEKVANYAFAYSSVSTVIFELGSAAVGEGRYVFSDAEYLTNLVMDAVEGFALAIENLKVQTNVFAEDTELASSALTGLSAYDRAWVTGDYAFFGGRLIAYLGTEKDLTLPSEIGGSAVTEIGSFFLPIFVRSAALPSVSVKLCDSAFSAERYADSGGTVYSELMRVDFSSASVSVGEGVFYATQIKEISLLLENCQENAFFGAEFLTAINVEGDAFSSEGGVLFDKEKTEIVCYPAGRRAVSYTLPASVRAIGAYAFSSAVYLAEAVLPDGLLTVSKYAFSSCIGLISLALPVGLQNINEYAFYNCIRLTSLSLPESLVSYSGTAVAGCTSLTNISASGSYMTAENVVFTADGKTLLSFPAGKAGAYSVPDGVEKIAPYAFFSAKLTSVIIPESVFEIGEAAFKNTQKLITVNAVESKLTALEREVFSGCSSLETVVLPDGIASFGEYAFSGCEKLLSINLPDTLEKLGAYAFENCSRLTTLILPENILEIGEFCFKNCSSLTKLVLPKRLENAGQTILWNCKSVYEITMNLSYGLYELFGLASSTVKLKEVTVHDGVSVVPEMFFTDNMGIERVNLPMSLVRIEERAFYNCTSLQKVVVTGAFSHQKLRYIGEKAFWGCEMLRHFETKVPSPVPEIETDTFMCYSKSGELQLLPNLNIYVPADYVSAYKQAWGIDAVYAIPS